MLALVTNNLQKKTLILLTKYIINLEFPFSRKRRKLKFIRPKTKAHNIFDIFKSQNCVLINPQTTILAIIGV